MDQTRFLFDSIAPCSVRAHFYLFMYMYANNKDNAITVWNGKSTNLNKIQNIQFNLNCIVNIQCIFFTRWDGGGSVRNSNARVKIVYKVGWKKSEPSLIQDECEEKGRREMIEREKERVIKLIRSSVPIFNVALPTFALLSLSSNTPIVIWMRWKNIISVAFISNAHPNEQHWDTTVSLFCQSDSGF